VQTERREIKTNSGSGLMGQYGNEILKFDE
jgi:hypothetical protein